jgi:hypothetical protein
VWDGLNWLGIGTGGGLFEHGTVPYNMELCLSSCGSGSFARTVLRGVIGFWLVSWLAGWLVSWLLRQLSQ